MSIEIVQILQPYFSQGGLLNPGDICGLDSVLAATLIASGTAAEYTTSAGAGVPTASPFRGIGAGETPAAYQAAGGAANTTPSAAVEGFLGGSFVNIVDGRAVPNAEPWA
jgi:hypothetical protein